MAKVRNPWNFPLYSDPLGRSLKPGEIVDTDDERAEKASRTGVFQWLEGPDGYDGKVPVYVGEGRARKALTEDEVTGKRGRKSERAAIGAVEESTAGDAEIR